MSADDIIWAVNESGRMVAVGVRRPEPEPDPDCCANCVFCNEPGSVAPGEDWVLDMERSNGFIPEESAICVHYDGVISDRGTHLCDRHERRDGW